MKKHGLTFRVLGDPGNTVAARFGLVFSLPEDLSELYKNFGIDFKRFYGEENWQLPMPGRFILDSQGTVVHRAVHPDYTKRPEPDEIVDILTSIG